MLSPLKPLLCRHEFYWSERHRSDLCRRCGKTRAAEAQTAVFDEDFVEGVPETERRRREPSFAINGRNVAEPVESAFFDIPAAEAFQPATTAAMRPSPSAKVLKAQALERRENLLALLDRIAGGGQPNRRDSLDAILAVIEDAHSADPVLFGSEAARHFAKLHEARNGLIF
ncbi:MAG: hypothetical protein Q8O54_10095 [Brevundimonas sp.]|nr:hypothetical protein [Brevundimonas sp.]